MRFKATYEDAKADKRSIDQILREVGLGSNGSIQAFHTNNVLRRIQPYMPKRTGALRKLMVMQTDINQPFIRLEAPQAHYLYQGKVWVDPVTKAAGFMTDDGWKSRKGVNKVPTNRDLVYHGGGGSLWAQKLAQQQGKQLVAELQAYIDSGRAFK